MGSYEIDLLSQIPRQEELKHLLIRPVKTSLSSFRSLRFNLSHLFIGPSTKLSLLLRDIVKRALPATVVWHHLILKSKLILEAHSLLGIELLLLIELLRVVHHRTVELSRIVRIAVHWIITPYRIWNIIAKTGHQP